MVLKITDAELQVFSLDGSGSEADVVFDASDDDANDLHMPEGSPITITQRVAGWKDVASFDISNHSAYTGDVWSGCRLEFLVQHMTGRQSGGAPTPEIAGETRLGAGPAGATRFGGGGSRRRRNARGTRYGCALGDDPLRRGAVRRVTKRPRRSVVDRLGPRAGDRGARQRAHGAAFDAHDFVFETMANRRYYGEFLDREIASGDPNHPGIVEELIPEKCPEISTVGVQAVPAETDISSS